MNLSFWQAIFGLVGTIAVAVVGGFFAYKQVVKTAEKTAESKDLETKATLEGKRLDASGALQNLWHQDFQDCTKRCIELADKLEEANKSKFEAQAELSMCRKQQADVEGELAGKEVAFSALKAEHEALDLRNRSTETSNMAMRHMMTNSRMLRAALALLEEGHVDANEILTTDWMQRLEQWAMKDRKEKESA